MRKGLPSMHLTVRARHSHKTELRLQKNTSSWHLTNSVHWADFYQSRRKFDSNFPTSLDQTIRLNQTLQELKNLGIFIKANKTIVINGASSKEQHFRYQRDRLAGAIYLVLHQMQGRYYTVFQQKQRNMSGWIFQYFHKAFWFRFCPDESWNHSAP